MVVGGQIMNLFIEDLFIVVCVVNVDSVIILFNNKNVIFIVQ